MLFKILSGRRYRQMLSEQARLHRRQEELDDTIRDLERQKKALEDKHKRETSEYRAQLAALEQTARDFEALQERLDEDMNGVLRELGLDREQVEKLLADRQDQIELCVDKLYSLSKQFARANKEMRKNRGLFLLLVDYRSLEDGNFSEFHEGQKEHLAEPKYKGIDQLAHIFSAKIHDVFNYMGEKIILKDEKGEITGYEERDGAVIIDLRGVAFRSRIMVEGVRTYRVYDRVERLQKGSAKHNAAIYASSLKEVMAAITISEETSEVTLFRDGLFVKSYDPYTDTETQRKEKIVPMKRTTPTAPAEPTEETDTTLSVEIEEQGRLAAPPQL